MAKRKNRITPIEHERRQLENLKGLEPIETPEQYMPLSDALFDLVLLALDEARSLEDGNSPDLERLKALQEMASALTEKFG